MFTTRIEHSYTITTTGAIEHRQERVIEEDGVEVTRKFHRRVLEPDQDTRAETEPRLLAIIGAVWTEDLKREWAERKRRQAEQPNPIPTPTGTVTGGRR